MHYLLVSISHKNTDLAIREKLAFDSDRQAAILKRICGHASINEAVILVTCNRVELTLSVRDPHAALGEVFDALHAASGVNRAELEGRAQSYEDEGAARHLFSVASGLESVVIGEAQIAGQFREAFRLALEKGFAGKKLTGLMNHAMRCAAAVRSATEVGKNPVSVSSAAVVQARQLLGSLRGATAVVVGNGEMSRLAALHLLGDGAEVIVVGRDLQKAQIFAAELGPSVKSESFARLPMLINTHPLLFTATGAPHTVINPEMIERREFKRYWFDIAVPRDIAAIEDENITVYAVDDLQGIVQTNMSLREEEAAKAFTIVGEHVADFFNWLQSLSADPVIKALRERASAAVREELDRAVKKGFIPKENEENVRLLLHNAFKRFLHVPTVALRARMDKPEAQETLECVRQLFDLEGN
ncbi:MAG: glutamyl-tRNA reductase [Campylobacterales bacterium]